jgi:hypothetical protein
MPERSGGSAIDTPARPAMRASRVIRWLLIGVACALVFLVPSSYVAARGGPVWLSAVVGALAFPVLPVGWHLFAERRRRQRIAAAAAASKTTVKAAAGLTSVDRLALRIAAVALIAIAPLVALDRGRLWSGVRHHATWFVPSEPATFSYGNAAPLVAHLPDDAEVIAIARDHPIRLIDPASTMRGAMVAATKGGHSVIAVPAQAESRKLAEGLGAQLRATMLGPLLGSKLEAGTATVRGDAVVITDSDWGTTPTAGGGPGGKLRGLLREVPAHALIAIAFAPADPGEKVREAVAWLGRSGDSAQLRARVALADAAAAEQLVSDLEGIKGMASRAPACAAELAALVAGVAVARDAATVHVRVDVPTAKLRAVVTCMKPTTPR